MKSNNGYSLIEIVVGLVMIAIFLLCTGTLINASFTNYRLVLQRSEALDIAIKEMEEVLQSDSLEIVDDRVTIDKGEIGYNDNDKMSAKVVIEKIKNGNRVYDDKVFLVTVNVEYLRTPRSTQKYNVSLQSLKVME